MIDRELLKTLDLTVEFCDLVIRATDPAVTTDMKCQAEKIKIFTLRQIDKATNDYPPQKKDFML